MFLRVYPKIGRLDATAIRYVLKAAGNMARSYVTSSYRKCTVGYENHDRVTTTTAFDYVHEKETAQLYQERVQPALKEIPEKYRAALAAYMGDERPFRVVKREGMATSTLLSRKKRAVEMLRKTAESKR